MMENLSGAEVAAILAIDPGPERSATCCIDSKARILRHTWMRNEMLLTGIRDGLADGATVLIESPQAQDRPLGPLLRDTIWWAGRFSEALDCRGSNWIEAEEPDVRLWLTGNPSGNNSALLAALKQRFGDKQRVNCNECGATGKVDGRRGPKDCPKCKGETTLLVPGPLSALNEHERSALAVAVWHWERTRRERKAV